MTRVATKAGGMGLAGLFAAPIHIRIASPEDAAAIALMAGAERAEHAGGPGANDDTWLADSAEQIAASMRCGRVLYVLATRLGVPVGFLRCRCGEQTWTLEQVYVAPSHRRDGVSALLLHEIDNRAHRCGLDSTAVVVSLKAS